MKKILSLFLALSLVFALMGCLPAGSMEAPVQPTLPEIVTEAPTEITTEAPTQAPTEAVTEPATEAVTEETDPIDPRPHPADVKAEQDRLNAAQDRDEALRKEQEEQARKELEARVPQDGHYTSKEDVALYIHLYGCLPGNYITKNQAKSQYGSTSRIPSYMNIGGDRFQNREGRLPAGHTYYECDIGTSGGRNRGAKRIVFSTDGLVYYTSDHYQSFTLLYGEP